MAFNNLNQSTDEIINQDLPQLITDEQLESSLANSIGVVRAYLLSGDPIYKELFNEYTEEGLHYERLVLESNMNDRYQDLIAETTEWRNFIKEKVFKEYDLGNETIALNHLLSTGESFTEMIIKYQDLAKSSENAMLEKGQDSLTRGKRSMLLSVITTSVVFGIGVLISFYISTTIAKPLIRVSNRMKVVATGDLTGEELQTKLKDEIGEVIHATNDMISTTKELLTNMSYVSETVTKQGQELTHSAQEVKLGAEQIAVTMEELATGSESQAHNASELSSTIGSFVTQVDQTSTNSDHIQDSSKQVLNMTDEGSKLMDQSSQQMEMIDQIVHQAVQDVEGLDQHAQDISELVSVIQAIAEQTNLLALNAAIEAARAGEHGKGFAVVADEVRKLAEQSAASVANITEIVDRIQRESSHVSHSLKASYKDVEIGTTQIIKTSETFNQINLAITEMVERIHLVLNDLSNITKQSRTMSTTIEEIAAISEESAAGIEETSASSEEANSAIEEVTNKFTDLVHLASEMNQLLSRFTL